jgi:hypothetical protein
MYIFDLTQYKSSNLSWVQIQARENQTAGEQKETTWNPHYGLYTVCPLEAEGRKIKYQTENNLPWQTT